MTDESNPYEGMRPMTPEQFQEFLRQHNKDDEAREREALAFQLAKQEFLLGMSPTQLSMTAKLIMAAGSSSDAAAYMVGEITAIMKYLHKVDPNTGNDPYVQFFNNQNGGH